MTKCRNCGEPATGDFDSDRDLKDDCEYETTVECVSCRNQMLILILEPAIECHSDAINDSIKPINEEIV